MTLRGDHNQCPGCGALFNSTKAFEKHRVGPHEGNGRRCLDDKEMRARGMAKNVSGWWVSSLREKTVVCYDDPPGSEPVRRRI